MMPETPQAPDACQGCASSRRSFLREAAAAVATFLVALGASRAELAAMPVTLGMATVVRGSERTYAIPAADGATIDEDADVIVVRWQGHVWAFARSCPHQNTALRWLPRDARFRCPKHKSKYQPDGTYISGRATRSMDRHAIRRSGNDVIVDLAVTHRQDRDPAAWAAAQVSC